MGVGVYASTFHDRGGTFLVDGPLEIPQEEYDDFNESLVGSLESAARKIGLDVEHRRGFTTHQAAFDREFSAVADDGIVQVGWRSWESDFVVGVGPTRRGAEMLDHDPEEAVVESGRDAEKMKRDYDTLVENVIEYLRLSLMTSDFECRYRTSGYTTSAYTVPDHAEARMLELETEIAAGQAVLKASREESLAAMEREERIAVMKTLIAAGAQIGRIEVPFIDKIARKLMFFSPEEVDDASASTGVVASGPIPDEWIEHMDEWPGKDACAVPRNAYTHAWFLDRQTRTSTRGDVVISTADELAEATEYEVVVQLEGPGADTERWETLAETPDPQASLKL